MHAHGVGYYCKKKLGRNTIKKKMIIANEMKNKVLKRPISFFPLARRGEWALIFLVCCYKTRDLKMNRMN
jgi:hypothetical protein